MHALDQSTGPCTRDLSCLFCYANRRGRSNYRGHRGFQAPRRVTSWHVEIILKKPDPAERKRIAVEGLADDLFVKKLPSIMEYLVTEQWDDGSPREASALSVTIKDGLIQVALNDKAMKQSLYTSAATLQDALKLMEGCLRDGKAPWRVWKAGKGR